MTQEFFNYANRAATTLSQPLNTTQTNITLASGGGALLPGASSTGGPNGTPSVFYLSLQDAATQANLEIVLVTAKSGDVLTVLRAQQGTAGQNWLIGDLATQLITAGDMAVFQQTEYNSGREAGPPQIYTANSAFPYIPPATATYVKITLVAAGGGGGSAAAVTGTGISATQPVSCGAGGQGGAVEVVYAAFSAAILASGFTYSIGAGGAGSSSSSPGSNGGNTTVTVTGASTTYTAQGGTGGNSGTAQAGVLVTGNATPTYTNGGGLFGAGGVAGSPGVCLGGNTAAGGAIGGNGGATPPYGTGGTGSCLLVGATNPQSGTGYGAGGGGAAHSAPSTGTTALVNGASGSGGMVIFQPYY